MKINKTDYILIKNAIIKLIDHKGIDAIDNHITFLKNQSNIKNLEKRYAFDLLYSCVKNDFLSIYDLYTKGYNDDHIYTALKKAIKELNIGIDTVNKFYYYNDSDLALLAPKQKESQNETK